MIMLIEEYKQDLKGYLSGYCWSNEGKEIAEKAFEAGYKKALERVCDALMKEG